PARPAGVFPYNHKLTLEVFYILFLPGAEEQQAILCPVTPLASEELSTRYSTLELTTFLRQDTQVGCTCLRSDDISRPYTHSSGVVLLNSVSVDHLHPFSPDGFKVVLRAVGFQ